MITCKNIRWKNFLSTGNAWTEIQFDKSPSTLIIGENGSGKSTIAKLLMRQYDPDEGKITLGGKDFRSFDL